MAVRLISARTLIHLRRNLRPAIYSPAFYFRSFSDVAQLLPRELSTPAETAVAPVNDQSSSDEGPSRVPLRSSLNETELVKFSAIAETWWDAEGPFKPLHALNPTRLAFIRSTLCHHFRKDPNCPKPFQGMKFVDVGCRGGILSEPLARMGAMVTGVDAVDKNIKIARLHAESDPVTASIEYLCTTAGTGRLCLRAIYQIRR